MKKEDEERFSKQMHQLADLFTAVSRPAKPGCCPSGGPCIEIDPRKADEFNEQSQKVYGEFKKAGYDDKDWEDLMQRSGAGKRMGGPG